ncbi:hypothetical protein ACE6H2_013319 [Prunus campanulata]
MSKYPATKKKSKEGENFLTCADGLLQALAGSLVGGGNLFENDGNIPSSATRVRWGGRQRKRERESKHSGEVGARADD